MLLASGNPDMSYGIAVIMSVPVIILIVILGLVMMRNARETSTSQPAVDEGD